jgi:ribosomal protein S18 acetylase RimI-like enzyme
MSHSVIIRFAHTEDIPAIVEFSKAMALETEQKILDPALISRGVSDVFIKIDLGFYMVAEINGLAAAQLMITYEWSDWRDGVFWWIQSVYVAPAHRRQGLYRRMYEFILSKAKEDPSVCGIRLYVDKNNHSAKKTYEDLGMSAAHYDLYEVDFIM